MGEAKIVKFGARFNVVSMDKQAQQTGCVPTRRIENSEHPDKSPKNGGAGEMGLAVNLKKLRGFGEKLLELMTSRKLHGAKSGMADQSAEAAKTNGMIMKIVGLTFSTVFVHMVVTIVEVDVSMGSMDM